MLGSCWYALVHAWITLLKIEHRTPDRNIHLNSDTFSDNSFSPTLIEKCGRNRHFLMLGTDAHCNLILLHLFWPSQLTEKRFKKYLLFIDYNQDVNVWRERCLINIHKNCACASFLNIREEGRIAIEASDILSGGRWCIINGRGTIWINSLVFQISFSVVYCSRHGGE